MKILGIETSCDETSAAVISANKHDKNVKLLSNIIASSVTLHAKTGGIIPEIAAREQIKYIIPVIDEALNQASSFQKTNDQRLKTNSQFPDIDAIAVTIGPGLIGSLLVGVETAKTLAYLWDKPIIPVNHLYGHIYANWIQTGLPRSLSVAHNDVVSFPALALIASGGHTDLVLIHDHKNIQWISGTRDDAAGEAFDKIGRLLGLPYPAGPDIEQLAKKGNPKAFHFPRPLLYEDTLDFSFSGLKTAVLREIQKIEKQVNKNQTPSTSPLSGGEILPSSLPDKGGLGWVSLLNDQTIANLSRATQDAIIDVLVSKTLKAAEKYQVKSILLSGGVAANQSLVEKLKLDARRLTLNASAFTPPKQLCTDNAAMIASAAFYNYQDIPWQEITANPELHFD